MKGKKGYPVECKTKDTVKAAAKLRKRDGKFASGGSVHKAKDIGALPEGGPAAKNAGRASRGVHGKPLMSDAAGRGSGRAPKNGD